MQHLVNLNQSADYTYFVTRKRNEVNCLVMADDHIFSTEFYLDALVILISIIPSLLSFVKVQGEGRDLS